MKIVLVHGRAQGGKDAVKSRLEWLEGINKGLALAGVPDVTVEVVYPFYGDLLDGLVKDLSPEVSAVVDRGETSDLEFDPFVADIVVQMAERAGIDQDAALSELDVAEKGPGNWKWVHKLVEKLSEKAPWIADLVIGQFITDVKVYVSNAYVQSQVDGVVLEALNPSEPTILIAHSLGSVVAYNVLATHPELDIPLFITAGSPLGLPSIKSHLPIPLQIPADEWLNLTDPEDIVAVRERLDGETFVNGIQNIDDIENGEYAHSIVGYLSDERVGQILGDALQKS